MVIGLVEKLEDGEKIDSILCLIKKKLQLITKKNPQISQIQGLIVRWREDGKGEDGKRIGSHSFSALAFVY